MHQIRFWLGFRPRPNWGSLQCLIYLPRSDGGLSWPRWPVTYWDGLPAHRRSPIQVLTQQCTAGSWTHNPLITSPTYCIGLHSIAFVYKFVALSGIRLYSTQVCARICIRIWHKKTATTTSKNVQPLLGLLCNVDPDLWMCDRERLCLTTRWRRRHPTIRINYWTSTLMSTFH